MTAITWLADHALHLVVIAIYLTILARHAWVGRKHVESVDDYLVAGRRMGGIVIALSFYATFMSTNTFIGAAGRSWEHGFSWCVSGIVLTALACLSWFVVAPRFVPLTRKYGSLTVADFLGTHYGSQRVRQAAAVIVALSSLLYLVAIYSGAATALAQVLALRYNWCILAVMIIVTAYTLVGGFESVVLTDALQGVLMLVGAVAIVAAMLSAGGGMPQIVDALKSQNPNLVSWTNGNALSAALAYSLAVGVKYLVEPRQLSRFYGLKDARALRFAAVVAPLAIFVTYLCLLPVGAMARTVLPLESIENTDHVIPQLLGPANILGPFAGTMFLLVLASAAMSSIDSVLLVAASTIDRDVFQANAIVKTSANRSITRTRIWVVCVSLAAATAALLPYAQNIVQMTKFSGSLYGACFVPVLVVGLFVQKRSATAAMATMSIGAILVIAVFVLRKLGLTEIQEVYPGMLVGLLVYGGLSLRRDA